MCGICGKLLFVPETPSRELIQSMCETISHRGPDDEGVYTAPHIGLGQRRLSIIDLSPGACPPLSNEDHTLWLAYNGEIYNYRQLKAQLEGKGHTFRTDSDTEVILHLYEEHGLECLKQLQGMFAFALWDSTRKSLICARDPFGKKPLCYSLTRHSLVFGSEIKAVTADPDVPVEPDYRAIDRYLTYQYVPSPMTAFAHVRRLRPGEYLICDVEGRMSTTSYWSPPTYNPSRASKEELAAELLSRLRSTVRARMVSDVPLGALLSGGIDSGTVVALMAEASSRPVNTFSIGFEEMGYNELPYARQVAEIYDTKHEEMTVRMDAVSILPKLVYHYNEPFADSSALPTYYVSQMAREHVKVVLSGDGGDENLGGYGKYGRILSWNRWDALPYWLRLCFTEPARAALWPFVGSNSLARVRRGLAVVGARDVQERFELHRTILKADEKRRVYTKRFRHLLAASRVAEDSPKASFSPADDALSWMLRQDLQDYLPDCLMVKTDIAAMAHGLEVRSPFLDREVAELTATIPSALQRDRNGGKLILREAAVGLLPSSILTKPKSGFSVPVGRWLRGPLQPLLRSLLLDERVSRRGLLRKDALRRMVEEHVAGARNWSNRLWAFLMLELWFRELVD